MTVHAPNFIVRGSGLDAMQPGAIFVDSSRLARGGALPNDFILSRRILEVLQRHYPGHRWVVEVKTDQGVAFIRNFFADPRRGFVIHLSRCENANDVVREAMRAGGELLERYGIKRQSFREELYEGIWRKDVPGVPKIIETTDTQLRKRAW